MEISKVNSEKHLRNLWKFDHRYQLHVTITTLSSTEEIDKRIVHINDIEKRKQAYGICGECNEPGTGENWCQPCNAKRFKDNFINWTSGNKDIDEFIQRSQLDAVYYTKYLEWIPFENFKDVTFVTRGGFGKIYSAKWSEGNIVSWDIENQEWKRMSQNVILKSLDDSFCINTNFLNEVKSHLQIYLTDVIQCYGITQDPNTKNYMMVLYYCNGGNLRNNYLNNGLGYNLKIYNLKRIAGGLLDIHNAGMCQPVNNEDQSNGNKGIYGVLPYVAPEVLRGYQYTKASDIYSFGIVMNEYLSEEIPYNNIPHDHVLTIKICKGLRPNIFEYTPKLLVNLITRCWDTKAENRPTAKEVFQKLDNWCNKKYEDDKIYSQIDEYKNKITLKRLKRSSNNNSDSIQTHPQAIYTSRFINIKELSVLDNSDAIQSTLISKCFDCQLDESDLNEINQDNDDVVV
ncbi:kinase-like domain-containing protein [Rhizophagus clarus]|uniref:Kinase-like domain-containing protein n=1 Tax=Rhizophagus clarus TaxID=94130 RepID=A0A8H3QRB1_9GLOM|nr:kinase-like domain-containing protein [Rhizophagus clarus]